MENSMLNFDPDNVFIPFEVTDKGAIKFGNYNYIEFLQSLGIYQIKYFGHSVIVRIVGNRVCFVEKLEIAEIILDYMDNCDDEFIEEFGNRIKNALVNKARMLSEKSVLQYLKTVEIDFLNDNETESYFFFKNEVIQVTKDEITSLPYNKLQKFVLEQKVISRGINVHGLGIRYKSVFREFIKNIAGGAEERILAFETMIGYMLHRYQKPSKAKAVILLDSTINEINLIEGGTGKSLLVRALSYMRNLCNISGKDFKSSYVFAFQRVTTETEITAVNDIQQKENFENFFGRITDGFTISKKYKDDVFIPFEDSPKLIITSNYYLNAPSGNSTERRKYEIELSDHYGKHLTVFDDFGQHLFDEWNDDEWNDFSNYMLYCVHRYLKYGLVNAEPINLEERKLISEVGLELIDFMDEQLLNKTKFHKKELFAQYKKESTSSARYQLSPRGFTIKLKKYLEYKGIVYNETPADRKTFIEIISRDQIEPSLITLDDIKTNYRTVDTTNKLTRLINQINFLTMKTTDKIIAIDLETTGLDPFSDLIRSIALSFEFRKGYNIILPLNKTKAKSLIEPFLPVLQNETITKVFHNAKFDLKFLYQYGIEVKGQIIDTMLLAHLYNPNRKQQGLKELSEDYLGYKQVDFKQMLAGRKIEDVPFDELTRYACEDTDQTLQLFHFLNEKIISKNL